MIKVNGAPIDYSTVPGTEVMRTAVLRYIEHGASPGHFLTAVIQHDLFRAVERAATANQALLVDWVRWFYNKAPGGCHGSKERMTIWMEEKTVQYEARLEA